jgi:hypothetical protein
MSRKCTGGFSFEEKVTRRKKGVMFAHDAYDVVRSGVIG